MGIEGVLNKGFVTASADTVLNYVRTGSLWPVTFGLACCAVEMMQAGAARILLSIILTCKAFRVMNSHDS